MTKCPIYEEHRYTYDVSRSSPEDSVFVCICGHIDNEPEDAPAGG